MTCRPNFSLIVPQYGQTHLTQQLLDDLYRHETASFETLVVDDGSPIVSQSPGIDCERVRVLRQPHRGVTAAWNHGGHSAFGEILLFLNNDVRASGPFLHRFERALATTNRALVGVRWRNERAVPAMVAADLPRRLLEGWCFAMKRETWRRLHGFDESLRLYFSDTDFQWRLLRGIPGSTLQQIAVPELHHAGHASTRQLPARREQWQRDRQQFVAKWSG